MDNFNWWTFAAVTAGIIVGNVLFDIGANLLGWK